MSKKSSERARFRALMGSIATTAIEAKHEYDNDLEECRSSVEEVIDEAGVVLTLLRSLGDEGENETEAE